MPGSILRPTSTQAPHTRTTSSRDLAGVPVTDSQGGHTQIWSRIIQLSNSPSCPRSGGRKSSVKSASWAVQYCYAFHFQVDQEFKLCELRLTDADVRSCRRCLLVMFPLVTLLLYQKGPRRLFTHTLLLHIHSVPQVHQGCTENPSVLLIHQPVVLPPLCREKATPSNRLSKRLKVHCHYSVMTSGCRLQKLHKNCSGVQCV